jgi:hypothetical protein
MPGGAGAGEIWGGVNFSCDSHIRGGKSDVDFSHRSDDRTSTFPAHLSTQLGFFPASSYAGLRIFLSTFALSIGEEARRAGRG